MLVDTVAVSTDDAAIAEEARRLGATVIVRPDSLSGDAALSADAMAHALQALPAAEIAVLLQPTSPLRTADHLTSCLEVFLHSDAKAAVSVCRADAHPWKMLVGTRPVRDWGSLEQPRQALPPAWRPNGAIYVVRVDDFLREKRFFLQPMQMFEMNEADSIDIDSEADFAAAEEAMRRRELSRRWVGASLRFSKAMDMRRLNRTPAWRREIAADQAALSAKLASERPARDACPVCGSAAQSLFARIFAFDYTECGACGHIYSRTPPEAEAVQRLYAGAGDANSVQRKIYLDAAVYQRRVSDIALPKAAYVGDFVGERGRWIDIGCGVGEVVAAATQLGWQASGIESDCEEAAFARAMGSKVTEAYVTGENAAQLLRNAQVVSFFNVLEHIHEPGALLAAAAGALREGCLVVAEVPRHPSVSSLCNRLFPQMASRHIYPPDHLHVFTDESFACMIAAAGLRPLGVWYFGQDFFDLVCSAAAQQGLEPSVLYDRVLDLSPALQGVIDRAGLADTLLAVCERSPARAKAWRAASA